MLETRNVPDPDVYFFSPGSEHCKQKGSQENHSTSHGHQQRAKPSWLSVANSQSSVREQKLRLIVLQATRKWLPGCEARINSCTRCRTSQMTSEPWQAEEAKVLHNLSASPGLFLPLASRDSSFLPESCSVVAHQGCWSPGTGPRDTLAFPGITLTAGGSGFFEKWHGAYRLP